MKREATLDDLELVEGRAEIVNGAIVMLPSKGFGHSRAAMLIASSLMEYEHRTQLGYAIGGSANYIVKLANRRSFCPDVSFDPGPAEADGAPLFAVEVRSPGDYGLPAERSIASKRAEYFAAGTRIVWDVDLMRSRCIRSYRADAPDAPEIFRSGDEAHAEPALPGWRISVDEMLKVARPTQ